MSKTDGEERRCWRFGREKKAFGSRCVGMGDTLHLLS